MEKHKNTVEKVRIQYRNRKKLHQRIVFGIVAAVLAFGLILSSIVWLPGFNNPNDNAPAQVQEFLPVADLEAKAKASPKDTAVLVELAQAYQRENKGTKAVETYQKAVSLEPARDDLKNGLAGAYLSIGQYDQAIQVLKDVIKRNPDNKEAHYYYGHALVAKKEYRKAKEEFDQYIKLAGENDPEVENVKRLNETLKPLIDKQ